MRNQENRELPEAGGEYPPTVESSLPTEAQTHGEGHGTDGQPRWREVFRQAFEKARRIQQPVTGRRELGKDKSKSLLVLAGAAIAVGLLFLGVFSSPNQPGRRGSGRPGTPNLGRRVTPGQQDADSGRSVIPLLDADLRANQSPSSGTVTPEDIGRTARPRGPAPLVVPAPVPTAPRTQGDQYALGQVDFSDPALQQQPGYGVGSAHEQPPKAAPTRNPSEDEQLRKPSLVFVRSANEAKSGTAANTQPAVFQQITGGIHLPAGTRLVARLESPASTAVDQPVVAVIEYNYERDGQIVIPAGAKAVGQLRKAERNGFVDIQFQTLRTPDGVAEKLDGVAMGLDFKPLKGKVTGKNTGTRFLVRAFTGLGTAASYLVGHGGSAGFYGPISQSALLRERIANNLGVAGEQELNTLAANESIAVTVPGNTRFYVVLGNTENVSEPRARPAEMVAATPRYPLPTLDELRQLMQLRQELSAMYQQTNTPPASAEAPRQ